jgi:hypothetical protein
MRNDRNYTASEKRTALWSTLTLVLVGAFACPSSASPNSPARNSAEGKLERSFQVLNDAERKAATDTYDLASVVRQAGGDSAKLFEWVRDRTSWAPYRGALRGSMGVLMDRTGNSLDRALLLADLLRMAHIPVRLAHGRLSGQQAADLFTKLAITPLPLFAPTIDGAAPLETATAATIKFDRLTEDLNQRVIAQTLALLAAIGRPDRANHVPATVVPPDATTLDALADHWWVQYKDGETWIDLDPLLRSSQRGNALTQTTDTALLNPEDAKPPIDPKLWHEVQIRVIAEQWKSGHLTESVVLSQTLRPAELLDRRVSLTHYPLDWPGDPLSKDPQEAVRGAKAAILAQHEWAPVLTIGDDPIIVQSSVSDQGEINPKPVLNTTARTGKKVAEATGLAGDLFGADPVPDPAKSTGLFTAEWIEFEICSPGRPTRKIRRVVFDLIGPAGRARGISDKPVVEENARVNAGFALMGHIDMLAVGCQLSPEFVQHLLVTNLLSNQAELRNLIQHAESKDAASPTDAKPPKLSPGCLYGMALMRGRMGRFQHDVYLADTNIFCIHDYRRLGENDTTILCQGFDIVANEIAVRPHSKQNPFAVRLEQGVRDTNAEALFLYASGKRENVAELFALVSSPGESWVTVRKMSDAALSDVHLSDDSRSRIDQALATGMIVIAPRNAVKRGDESVSGWWVIDPKTGQALGIGEQGWGTTLVEYGQRVAMFVNENREFICTAKSVYEIVGAVAVMLGQAEIAEAAGTVGTGLAAICGEP